MKILLRRILFVMLSVTMVVGVVYYQLGRATRGDQTKDTLPDIGGAFSLTDQHGNVRTDQEFRGKYMLVYFGYSYCPDICPMGLTNISQGLRGIKNNRDEIVVLFITVDPERDDVPLLKNYSQNYDPNILFLTGDRAAIDAVKAHYKVFAARVDDVQTTDYLMDHSTLIYLMDRSGKFIDHFPHTVDPKQLTDRLTRLLAQEKVQ